MIACGLSTVLLFLFVMGGIILMICGGVSGVVLVLNRDRDRRTAGRLVAESRPRWGERR